MLVQFPFVLRGKMGLLRDRDQGSGFMGRAKRADEANGIYHMLNRANRRATLFKKDTDYGAFERILCEAAERFRVELFCYCLMPNHWKHGASSEKKLLSGWPISRSPHWVDKVAMALSDRELKRLRWSERRGSRLAMRHGQSRRQGSSI